VADSADYRCCAVQSTQGYAPGTPSGEKEKRAKRIWAEADWREGGAAAVGTQDKRDSLAGVGCGGVDIIISPANSNIAPRALAICCAARLRRNGK